MPDKNQNIIPNSNNLFAIFQSQVVASAVLVDIITKSGVDKNLVKTVKSAAKTMDTALDVIYKSLEKMSTYDVGKSNEAAKAILSTTKAINSLTTVVANVNKVNLADVSMARKSIERLMTLMFGKPGKNPTGLIPLLKKAGDGRSTKSITNGIKNLKHVSTAAKELAGTAVILGLALPFVAVAILSGKLLHVVVKGLLKTFSLASRNEKQIMTASKAFKNMAVSLMLFVASIVLIGITMVLAAPLVAITLVAILGLVGMMIFVGVLSKRIDAGIGELMKVAKALLVLSLTTLLLALTGQFIVANWENFLIIGAYMIVLLGVFFVLSVTSKWIENGVKYMLYIAGAITILAGTAMLMAFIGQFITANWENMLIIGSYLVVLVGAFMLLAYSSKWIQNGAKQMLWIALTVSILIGVAFLMIIVGNLLKVNWESVLTVTLLLTVLVGAVCLVAQFSNKIEKGWKAMLIVALFSIVMTAVVFVLAKIANSADLLELLEVVRIMALIIVAIGGAAVAAGALQEQIENGMIAMALIAGMSLVMSIVMKNIATAASIAPPLEILEVSGIMASIVVALGAVSIAAGALLAGPQAILFGLGLVAMGSLSLIGLAMAEVVKHTAIAAMAVKAAGFKEPKEVTEIISLPIKVFTMEDKDGKSLFGYIADLPNPIAMARYVGKVESLAKITNSIGLMADILQHIASLNMPDPDKGYDENGKPLGWRQMKSTDFTDAAINAGNILSFFADLFADKPVERKTADGKTYIAYVPALNGLDNIMPRTRRKIKRLGKIASYIGLMADTLQRIASLNIPDPDKGYDENGKPLGWKQMKGTDFADAATNAGNILSFFADLFAEKPVKRNILGLSITVGMSNELAGLDNIMPRTRRKIKRLNDIVTSIGNMATTLQNVATLKIPTKFDENGKPTNWESLAADNFTKVTENVKLIAQTLIGAIASDDLSESLNSMDKKSAKNLARILESIGNINSIMDVVKQLGEDKYVKTWKIDENGNKIPDTYGSYTVLLKKSKTTETNIKTMIGIIVNPFSQYNHGKDERNLHGAADEIKTISKVINDGSNIINKLIGIYNDNLVKFSIDDYGKRWDIQIDVVNSMLKTIGGVKININHAKTIANNLDKAADLVKRINGINGVNLINLKMATGLINQTFGNTNIDKNSAKTIANNIDKTNDLIKRINNVNPDNLKTATKLMEHISKLSESIRGDFDGLAKAINENLLKALEKLTKALDDINEKEFNVHKESNVSTIGGTIAPSGSAGVKDKQQQIKQAQQPQANKNILTKKDIVDLKSSIDAIRNIFDGIVTTDRKVQVKI